MDLQADSEGEGLRGVQWGFSCAFLRREEGEAVKSTGISTTAPGTSSPRIPDGAALEQKPDINLCM